MKFDGIEIEYEKHLQELNGDEKSIHVAYFTDRVLIHVERIKEKIKDVFESEIILKFCHPDCPLILMIEEHIKNAVINLNNK